MKEGRFWGRKSVGTKLCDDIGIVRIFLLNPKVEDDSDIRFVPFGIFPFDTGRMEHSSASFQKV